jgi:two-component system, LytTR family, sensor kinase
MQKSKTKNPLWTHFLKRIKIITGAFIISLLFSIVLSGSAFHEGYITMFILTYIQLEIFLWLGNKFFASIDVSSEKFKQRIIVRLLQFYATVLVIAIVFIIAVFYAQYRIFNYDFENFAATFMHLELKGFFIATLIGFAIGTVLFFYLQWSEALKREQNLAQEKLIFQYETLKKQINPHFLFNSLNTLSSLVRTDPVLSEEFIHNFSGIYRYILENEDKNLVPLSEELQFVRDYFMLQKIRDEDKIELQIEINEVGKIEVLPVSLQLLIENALKHNAATRNNPLLVTLHQEGIDKLVVRNNLRPKSRMSNTSKTGLRNLNERCRLILNRDIEILQTETEYIVKVPVKYKLK